MSISCPSYVLKILNEMNLPTNRFLLYLPIFLRQKATYSLPKHLTGRKMNQTLIVLGAKLNLHYYTTTTFHKNMKSNSIYKEHQ